MQLEAYPVLPEELSLSKVITPDGDDMIVYNTKTGIKAYPTYYAFEFEKRCRGTIPLQKIISELSQISGEPPETFQHDLAQLIRKLEENGMITFLPSPLEAPRPEPPVVELYSRIENVSLEVTRKCNVRCKHCYGDSGEKKENELTFEEIIKLIDELADLGVLCITLTGGEPLLHPRLFDIIAYIRRKPMSCRLLTNGMLITKAVADRLKELGVLSVSVSIDGATPETHDAFRGVPGGFKKVIQGIKVLQKAEIPVSCNISIHRGNLTEFAEILNLLEELNIVGYRLRPVSYTGRSEESDIFVTPEEYTHILEQLRHYEREHGEEVKKEITYTPKTTNCGAGIFVMVIKSDGTVVPCPPFPDDISPENIREKSVAEIWNNSELFNEMRRINVFEHTMCGECPHINVCKGGCIADVYMRTGVLDCGDVFECAFFEVNNDYVPVAVDKQATLSGDVR